MHYWLQRIEPRSPKDPIHYIKVTILDPLQTWTPLIGATLTSTTTTIVYLNSHVNCSQEYILKQHQHSKFLDQKPPKKKKNLGLVHKTHASNTERMQPKGLEGLIALKTCLIGTNAYKYLWKWKPLPKLPWNIHTKINTLIEVSF